MAYVMVRNKIQDYPKFKQAFEGDRSPLEQAGFKKYGLYRSLEDSNEVVIFLEHDDIDRAKSFFKSDHFRDQVKKATVIGEPEITYLDMIEKNTLEKTEKAA